MCEEKIERNTHFVHMGNLQDRLFQLMKYGTDILHVGFIFFVSVDSLALDPLIIIIPRGV
jgi:hypothetical protein